MNILLFSKLSASLSSRSIHNNSYTNVFFNNKLYFQNRNAINYIGSGLSRNFNQAVKARTSLLKTKKAGLEKSPPNLVGKSLIGGSLLLGCVTGKCIYIYNNKVLCEGLDPNSRLVAEKSGEAEPKFDWIKFKELLKPHWWYLVIAITVSTINIFNFM